MAASHLNKAKSLPHRFYPCAIPGRWVKALLSITLPCFLVLFSGGCGSPPSGQVTSTSSPGGQQQLKGQLVYVAIGASDTFGYGTDDPYDQNWATDLEVKLGPRYHLINLGVPGIQIHRALTVELPVALDAHPDLVTIWLAVNDIIDNVPLSSYSQDLDNMLSRLQAEEPDVRIAVANVPDLKLLPYFHSFDQQKLQAEITAYNAAIAAIVHRHHALLVDLYQPEYDLKNHPEYVGSDGLHPTAIGYERIADLFYQVLQKAQDYR